MIKTLLLSLLVISSVISEGYFCPYPELGGTVNDILYDYYSSNDDGATWNRIGETGFSSRTEYCAEKGDASKHFDAGEAKCSDSVGNCFWDEDSCQVNLDRAPDCLALCQAILNGEGLPCLGGTCGNREDVYAICDEAPPPVLCRPRFLPASVPTPTPVATPVPEVVVVENSNPTTSRYPTNGTCASGGTYSTNEFDTDICDYAGGSCAVERYFTYPGGGTGVEFCCGGNSDCNYDPIKNYCHPGLDRCVDGSYFGCSDKEGPIFDSCL